MSSKVRPEDTYSAFSTEESVVSLSKRLRISPNTIKAWWIEKFGQEAYSKRGKSKVSREDTYPVFHTEEPFKAYAKRLGMSPNTLRVWWIEKFGQGAFDERGTRLQRASAVKVGSAKKGTHYTLPTQDYSCDLCSDTVSLNALQVARRKRILCDSCIHEDRGFDRRFPVCHQEVAGNMGMSAHYVQNQDEPHLKYRGKQKNAEWEGKKEFHDFVVCKVCGFRDSTLGRHIGSAHNLTAEQYRQKFPGAYIVSKSVTDLRSDSVKQAHAEISKKGLRKTILCDMCDTSVDVSAFQSSSGLCDTCDAIEQESEWVGQTTPEDYVVCQKCGYKAENLTSHIQNAHPNLVGVYSRIYPGFTVVALESNVRDKSLLIGRVLSDSTKQLMSENAGRWNKGLTKETDERVAASAEKMVGRESWSKGLTKEEHPPLQSTSEKLQEYVGEKRPWSNGLEAELTYADFAPFLEADGVDRVKMAEDLNYCPVTITKYMDKLGLPLSKKYIRERSEAATIRLDKETLEQHTLKNGKVQVGKVMIETGHDRKVVIRECDRHGLPYFARNLRQTRCLSAISKVLNNAPFEQEWRSRKFMTERGNFYRFDGYFPSHELIVEFHGHQHYEFPSVYVKTEEAYFAAQERDRIKENLVQADPVLRYLVVREDEPFDDVEWLRSRLQDILQRSLG